MTTPATLSGWPSGYGDTLCLIMNMKSIINIILTSTILLCNYPSYGQVNNETPSHLELSKSIFDVAVKYRFAGLLDQSKELLEAATAIVSTLGYDSLTITYKIELSEVLLRKSFHYKQVDSIAFTLCEESLKLAQELENDKLIGDAIHGLGYFSFKLGRDYWDASLDRLNEAIEYRDRSQDYYGLAKSHFTIGVIQQRRGELEKAEESFRLSLKYSREVGSKFMEAENQRHIGYLFYMRRNYSQAMPFFLSSLELREEIGYVDGAIFAAITIGSTYSILNNNDLAIEYLENGLFYAKKINSPIGKIRAGLALSKIYLANGNKELASKLIDNVIHISTMIGDSNSLKQAESLKLKVN